MKSKYHRSIRNKIVMSFAFSGMISGVITGVIYFAVVRYYRYYAQAGDTLYQIRQFIRNTTGDFIAFMILFLPIFFVVFYISTKYYGNLLDSISQSLSDIAGGNYDTEVAASQKDEIGELAQNVNAAATKLKRAVQNEALAENSKDRLVMNIAHDLRTPLTSINGYLRLILDNKNLSLEQVRHYAEIAYNKSTKMERLIEELFDFTKYNYGKVEPRKERLDLAYLLNQVVEEFYPSFNENRLEGRLSIEKSPVYIEGDGDLIARVFDNIISNAIHYGNEGKYVDIEMYTANGKAVVKIINYASYIAPQDLDNIFESFYRADKSRSMVLGVRDTPRAGLGLAIAKNIVELHNGVITASSSMECTVFEVRLNVVE